VQKEVGSYFTSWGIYERQFFPKVSNSSSLGSLTAHQTNRYWPPSTPRTSSR
jgi:hypothetical protein